MEGPSQEAFEFEKYLIEDPQQWDVPSEAWAIYQKDKFEGYPTGIAKHPEMGWAVVSSCGQGPMILWKEELTKEEQVKLMQELVAIVYKMRWAVSIPMVGESDAVPGMIIGIPEYVEGILDFVPEDFSDRFKNRKPLDDDFVI